MATFSNGRVALPVRLPGDVYKMLREFSFFVDCRGSMNSVVNQAVVDLLADPVQRERLNAAKAERARAAAIWARRHPGGGQ